MSKSQGWSYVTRKRGFFFLVCVGDGFVYDAMDNGL